MRYLLWLLLLAPLIGCAASGQGDAGPAEAARGVQAAITPGTWRGLFDDNPNYNATLTISSASPQGQIRGVYLFQTQRIPFNTQVAENRFSIGSATFAFLQDGRIRGTFFGRFRIYQAVLVRD